MGLLTTLGVASNDIAISKLTAVTVIYTLDQYPEKVCFDPHHRVGVIKSAGEIIKRFYAQHYRSHCC